MSDGTTNGLGAGAGARAHDRAEEEKTTREQAERWTTLLGTQLSAMAAPALPKLEESSASPSGWHPGVGDLTPPTGGALTSPGAANGPAGVGGEGSDPAENRLIVRVDGGDLGEVALVVDRKEGAIRVTISAADAGAEAALGSERAGLLQALKNQGITVDSLKVVRANDFGTPLAPSRSNATQRAARDESASEAESKADEQTRRRLARKLNLIG